VADLNILSTEVRYLAGVGPRRAEVLARVGVHTVRDLLHYFPRRYLDRSTIVPLRRLDERMGSVTVVGTVRVAGVVEGKGRKRFELILEDESGGRLKCVWFNRLNWVAKAFKPGDRVAFHGKVQRFGYTFSMTHPDFDRLDGEGPRWPPAASSPCIRAAPPWKKSGSPAARSGASCTRSSSSTG